MRVENIEVTFKIPVPVDKPDLNGNTYSKKAMKNAYKNAKNIPIEIPNDKGKFVPIGVCQEAELIEDETGMYIKGVGTIWHGGTSELVTFKNNVVDSVSVTEIGFTTD